MNDTISIFSKSTDEIDFYTADYGVHVYENVNAEYSQLVEQAYITRGSDFSLRGSIEDIYVLDNGLKILILTSYQALLFDISDKINPIFLEEIELSAPPT